VKRRHFLQVMAVMAAAPAWGAAARFERGLLWRIAGKGAASYVYGTIRDADPRLAELPQAVGAAFERAGRLMVETVSDLYSRGRFAEAALLPDGQTLEGQIGAEDFGRAVERLAPVGLAPELVNRLKPWAALLSLPSARASPAAAGEALTLEAQLLQRAHMRRMPVSQMEGVEETIFTFDECPLDTQVVLLRHSLAHAAELAELASRTLAAYIERDLSAIWRLREQFIARYPEVAAHQAIMTKRLLHDRSVVMAYRMQRELRRGGAFVALGALHLYGARGVLALLEQDGYRPVRAF
jgi:hypothetical protein